jgi:hypothetical protein
MPNDPLPVPEILAASQSADYEAVYAAIAATEAGRNFLADYARRHGHQDAHKFVSIIARLEAAVHAGQPPHLLATLAEGFADLVAAIQRIEAVLSPSTQSTPDVHFAVERIQDIAAAVRSRDVEAALCDSLEAAIREVGDAIVRGDAAAAGALSAAHLLRDLARRAENMSALLATGQIGAPERFDDTAPQPAAGADVPAVQQAESSAQPCIGGNLDIGAQSQPPRAAFDDALAPLLALSEEELIALFS